MADADFPPAKEAAAEAGQAFVAKWQGVAASELSTFQSFLIDLCGLLGLDAPHAASTPTPPATISPIPKPPLHPCRPTPSRSPGPRTPSTKSALSPTSSPPAPSPSIDKIAARFTARGPWKKRLPKMLEMLVALGRAAEMGGRFSPT